jgi:hypothetical protein
MAFCELQQERAIFAAAVDAECRRWTDETQIAYINCYESYAVWLVARNTAFSMLLKVDRGTGGAGKAFNSIACYAAALNALMHDASRILMRLLVGMPGWLTPGYRCRVSQPS